MNIYESSFRGLKSLIELIKEYLVFLGELQKLYSKMSKFLDEMYDHDNPEYVKIKVELKKAYDIYVKFLIFNFIRTGLKMDQKSEDKNEQ